MNGQRPAQTPRKKTMLDDYRQPHPQTDSPAEGGKYPAQLVWQQKNNGAIVMKVSDGVFKQGAKTDHKEVELSVDDRGALFEALLDAANEPNFKSKQIVVRKHQFVFQPGGGRMSENPVTQVTLTIARDDNGCISLGYSKGDYKQLFRFKGPNSTVVIVRNEQGEKVEDHGLMSRWMVRHWVSFHKPVLERMELDGWSAPKPRGDVNGNGGNGGNGYNNNGGGRSEPSMDYDEDIDF